MLLSYPVWQRRFGGRADVVNQTVQVDGQTTLILGVMPEGFGLLDNSSDAWFTFGFAPSSPAQETQHSLRAVGRLKPGVSIAQAQAAVKLALDEYAQTFPNRDKGWTVELTPWREARFGGLRQPLTMVQLAVGVMLLLLCVNLAVLLLARTASRERSAVLPPGQSRPGIVLAESLMLSLGGGVIGAVVTWLGLPALLALTPRVLPRLDEVTFDASVFAFAAILCRRRQGLSSGSCRRGEPRGVTARASRPDRAATCGGGCWPRHCSWRSWPCKWRSRSSSWPGQVSRFERLSICEAGTSASTRRAC